MRILHTISSVNPSGGGPIEAIRQIAAVHITGGHHVEVASLDDANAPFLNKVGIKVNALGPGRGALMYSRRFGPWLSANAKRFDAVVINGLWQFHAFATWRALPRALPYFVYPHGMLDPWFKRTYPLKHLKKWMYWPWADYWVLRNARSVLFTAEEERLSARESFWLYRARERVVGLGTRGPSGDAVLQRREFLSKFPEIRGKRCLLFLGRVHVKKGPDLLLRALASVLSEGSDGVRDLHLIMAGPNDHEYGREMRSLAESLGLGARVTWTGMITGDRKWGAFYAADAFILPSHQENFGIAVAESLACGTPVLVTKRVNIWREIADEGAGFVEEDTIRGTIRLIRAWMDAPREEWADRRNRARACFEKRFTIQKAAESLIDVIREFVPERS